MNIRNAHILALFLFLSTAAAAQKPGSSLLKKLTLQTWDNVCAAQPSADGSLIVRHIASGDLVTGVNCDLEAGTTISPKPDELIGRWPKQVTFTLSRKRTKEHLTVRLADFVEPSEQSISSAGNAWRLVWNDEFATAEPDWNVWSRVPRGRANWQDDMTDDPRLFDMKNGLLVLKGMANTICPSDTSKYLTGGLWGKDKKGFQLGRIDVRARFSSAKGFWPAIWLLPLEHSNQYSDNGEIDMMEHLNFDKFAYQTVHTEYTNLVNKTNPKNHYMPSIDPNGFNTYTVEVFPDSLVYSVNGGAASYTYPRLQPAIDKQFPFDHNDYFVVLSAQLGGDWVGSVSLAPEEVVTLEIDYVRYYRAK